MLDLELDAAGLGRRRDARPLGAEWHERPRAGRLETSGVVGLPAGRRGCRCHLARRTATLEGGLGRRGQCRGQELAADVCASCAVRAAAPPVAAPDVCRPLGCACRDALPPADSTGPSVDDGRRLAAGHLEDDPLHRGRARLGDLGAHVRVGGWRRGEAPATSGPAREVPHPREWCVLSAAALP